MSIPVAVTAALLDRRAADEQSRLESWQASIHRRIPAAAELLRRQYGARRVWLFGSFAVGAVHFQSDVDLAAEGIDPAEQFRAMADLMGMLGARVDLVRVEDASPRLTARIAAEGIAL